MRPHDDRLFPADPACRAIARRLYEEVAGLPLISPHGHVDAGIFARDEPFGDPASLLITPDHYVTRMIYAAGVPLESLGVGTEKPDPRAIWRMFCEHFHLFRGTPSRLWLEQELHDLFGIDELPGAANADALYDRIAATLADPEFRPRALFHRFGLELLTTTDSPLSDLSDHQALLADPSWTGRVVPTFRPDEVSDPDRGMGRRVARLGELTGRDVGTFSGYLDALRERRAEFIRLGATCTDHGFPTANTAPVDDIDRLYREALTGELKPAEAEAFRGHMLHEFARMSCDDGLVMQLHPGVLRDHHAEVFRRFGSDVGGDIPTAAEFTRALRPLLNDFGGHPNFTFVVFTVDETTFSRELAPLAGHYPAMRLGVPWWFLDAPDAIGRFRAAVTETAGFYNTAGFVDDTRAFCSIPARHDMARRLDCAFLSRLVAEHRLPEEEAAEVALDLAYRIPQRVYGTSTESSR